MRHALIVAVVLSGCSPATMELDGGSGGGSAGGTMATGGGTGGAGGTGGGSAGGTVGGSAGGAAGGSAGGAAGGSAGGAAGGSAGGAQPGGLPFVYVGAGNNIVMFELKPDAGLTPRGQIPAGSGSSFLAVHPSKRWLYAVNEGSSEVSSFAIDGGTGGLTFINRVGSQGSGPAHLSVHPSGRWVLVSNYGSGHVGVLPILDGGALSPTPVDTELSGMNAHQILSDSSGTSVYVPCLGTDRVRQYDFDGGLTAKTPGFMATASGAGPRHMDLHPNGRFAYLINETNLTMSALDVAANGTLTSKQTLSTLPSGASGGSTAEVFVHPAGHSVYGSNRGNNSIVHFRLDANGMMTLAGHTPTGGNTPRSFALHPDGTLLLVANQGSGTIVAMRVDPATGNLVSLGPVASGLGSPAYVGIVVLP